MAMGLGLGLGLSRGSGGFGVLPLASAATAAYYMDAVRTSPRPSIANQLATTAPDANLFGPPRRFFNNTSFYTKTSLTVVDDAAAGPDGAVDASSFAGTGNWKTQPVASGTYPAGTYTMAVEAMRNGGTDQQFSFTKDNTVTRSPANTATSAWQTFTYTFTLSSSVSANSFALCSIDGATAANLLVRDFRLIAGSADAPVTLAAHLFPGRGAYETAPALASGALDFTGKFGVIQLPTPVTVSTFTLQVALSQIGDAGTFQAFLTKVLAGSSFAGWLERSSGPRSQGDGTFNTYSGGTSTQGTTLWDLLNKGFHVLTVRHDGTNEEVFLDQFRLFVKTGAFTSTTVRDLYFNSYNNETNTAAIKYHGMAIWLNTALSNAQILQGFNFWKARGASVGVTIPDTADRIGIWEGDSITGESTLTHPYLYGPNASPVLTAGSVFAVAGTTLTQMIARAATIDGILLAAPAGRTVFLSVLMTNGLTAYTGATNADKAANWCADMAAYCDARRAAGFKVALGTMPPRTDATHNAIRALVNVIYRTWVGVHVDAIIDYAADPVMGPDAAASDTALYRDGVHPTPAGYANFEVIERPVLNAL
jgi:hypothetical protein